MVYYARIIYLKCLQSVNINTRLCPMRNLSNGFLSKESNFFHRSEKFDKNWQYCMLQTANFHSTQKLNLSALGVVGTCFTLQFGAAVCGYYTRRWWLNLPLDQQQLYKNLHWERRNVYFGSFCVFLFILTIYYVAHLEKDPIGKRRHFIIFSKEQELELGNNVFTALLIRHREQMVPITDPAYTRIVRVIRNLGKSNTEIFENSEWTVNIVNIPWPNAMIIPGGRVFVYSGIFDMIQNDDQLMFILAHEMSHVLLSHIMESLSYKVLQEIFFIVPQFFIWLCFSKWKAFAISALGGYLYNVLFDYPLKRSFEMEADEVGFQLSAKSCADLREVLMFWEILDKYMDLQGLNKFIIPILSTHPHHSKRQKNLLREMPRALKMREKAGCPNLPEEDPRKKLPEYIKKLEETMGTNRVKLMSLLRNY